MLLGKRSMSVDAKARVTLPSDFRKQMGKVIVIIPFGGHVNGFTPEGFKSWVNDFFNHGDEHFNPRNRRDVKLKHDLYANAVEVELDSAGRLALGKLEASRPGLLEKLALTSNVTVVGQDEFFEVWNTEKFEADQGDYEGYENELDSLLYGDEDGR